MFDYAFLQTHPLIRQLVSEAKGGASRVQTFRQLITEAIEGLNPEANVNLYSAQGGTCRLVWLRYSYIRQQATSLILNQLNLSERQFYRDHSKAVQILSLPFWKRIKSQMYQLQRLPFLSSRKLIVFTANQIQSRSLSTIFYNGLFLYCAD